MKRGRFYPAESCDVEFEIDGSKGRIEPGELHSLQAECGTFGKLALFGRHSRARLACLKVFDAEADRDDEPPDDIVAEAEALEAQKGRYAPAYICLGKALGEDDGLCHWAIAMEYLEGYRSIESMVVARGGTLDNGHDHAAERTCTLLVEIAKAIRSIHSSGHVHRDLSPRNILMKGIEGGNGDIRVIDFGQSTQRFDYVGTTGGARLHLGTPGFTAPEIFDLAALRGRGSQATSSFSLGALAYFIASGQAPFELEFDSESQRYRQQMAHCRRADESSVTIEHFCRMARIERVPIPLNDSATRIFSSDVKARSILLLIDACTHGKPFARPTMDEAIHILEGTRDSAENVVPGIPMTASRSQALYKSALGEYANGDDAEPCNRRVSAASAISAAGGNTDGALLTGAALERIGDGFPTASLSMGFYRVAADAGSGTAKTCVARLLLDRQSTEGDLAEALRLLTEAAASGNAYAKRTIDQLAAGDSTMRTSPNRTKAKEQR